MPELLADLAGRRAREDRDRPFCYFDDQVVTFGDADAAATRLANGLASSGIAPGDRVAVMLPSHPDHIYTLLALARLGAIHVPLNTHHKSDGIRHVLQHAEVSAVVADARFDALTAPAGPLSHGQRENRMGRSSMETSELRSVWRGGIPDLPGAHPVSFEQLLVAGSTNPVKTARAPGDSLAVASSIDCATNVRSGSCSIDALSS